MSAHLQGHSDIHRVKRRADYFFAAKSQSRGEVAYFAQSLLKMGPIVAIGGFLRDLLLGGNRQFKSDVDFVIDPASVAEFERFASRLGARQNRFGGYCISLKHWRVDVWPLQRTWAHVNGHVSVKDLKDLINITFFNWDAIVYSVLDQKVFASPGYFEEMDARVLDIKLEPNPNPLGNAVRAIRYAYRWDAALGNRLTAHIARQSRDHGWEALVSADRQSFPNPLLANLDGRAIMDAITTHVRNGSGQPLLLPLRSKQHYLPLSDDNLFVR